MNKILLALVILASTSAHAYTKFDPRTGTYYEVDRDPMGNTTVHGANAGTGSQWNTTVDRQGNQNGVDASGNAWNYNKNTTTYMNSGTGKMCTGQGMYRMCTGGN